MLELLKLINTTCKDYIKINAELSQDVHLWQSKFGGLPFLPEGIPYPRKSNGTPLHLLSQINCSEIPHLPPLPKEGLIQFYIADDDCYGLFEKGKKTRDGFKVLYIPEVNTASTLPRI